MEKRVFYVKRKSALDACVVVLLLLFLPASFAFAADITSIVVSDQANSQQTNVPFTFGHGFKQGDVPANMGLSARLSDGTSVPLQVDKKAAYADGSLKHAVLTAKLARLTANASETLTLFTKATVASTVGVSLSTLKASAFDAKVDIILSSGQTPISYSLSAKEVLQTNSTPLVWLSGPLVSEWIVGGPLKETATGNPHDHISVYFHIRAFAGANSDSIDRVSVDVVVENNWLYVAGSADQNYSVSITVPGKPSLDMGTIIHYHHARWHKRVWWGNASNVYVKHDAGYLQAAPMVPKYEALIPSESYLNGLISSVNPMELGNLRVRMADTGFSDTIGPLPTWVSAYILTTDRRAFAATLANGDGGGAYSMHYRDEKTGYPVSIENHTKTSILSQITDVPKPATSASPYSTDVAHMPSIGYVPYLMTGDYYYLEELQFWATYSLLRLQPGDQNTYRGLSKGYIYSLQVRGQAWALREIGRAAFITPDTHPLKQHYIDVINNNMDWYNANYTNNPAANKLGILENGSAYSYNNNNSSNSGIAPWQHDYFTWSIGQLVEFGFAGAKTFFPWVSKFALERMTGEPGYCWNLAPQYSLMTRPDSSSPAFASMAIVFEKNFPNFLGIACNSQAMMDELTATDGSGTYPINRMTGRSDSATSYYKFMQPALAMIVDFSPLKDKAELAWSRFRNNPTAPSAEKLNNTPLYAVVPRGSQIVVQTGDTDGDGLPDQWEMTHFGNLTSSNGSGDADRDGLKDADELVHQTDPKNNDTDGDGYLDGAEVKWGADPTSASDTKLQHQPIEPQLVHNGSEIPVYGFFFEINNYTDPDNDGLLETHWQVSSSDLFNELVFARTIAGQDSSLVIPAGVLIPNASYFIRAAYVDETSLQGEWSTPINIMTQSSYPNDADGNIVDDTYQFQATGVAENHTCTLMDAQTNSPIRLVVNNGAIFCFTSYGTSFIDTESIPDEGIPHGIINFAIKNVSPDTTVSLTIHFPDTVDARNSWYHYDLINDQLHKIEPIQYVGNSVILSLQDAGVDDVDGVANGVIVSAGGLGGSSDASNPVLVNGDTNDNGAGAMDFFLWLLLMVAASSRLQNIQNSFSRYHAPAW